MLSIPAAAMLIGPSTPLADTVPASTDEGPAPSGFWAVGGVHDVIVTFTEPCVVEKRLAWEASGIDDPTDLGDRSRGYKVTLEGMHGSFLRSVQERYPEVTVNQEYTTVLNGMALTASSEALDDIASHPSVERIEPDTEVSMALSQSVPLINADDLWAEINGTGSNITGKGIVVSVMDTGIDYSHPDLGGTGDRTNDLANVTGGTHPRIIGGWDVINNDADFWDGHFHGTHCAGIVGANGTVVGVAPEVDFLIYKVLSDGGSGPSSVIIKGVELTADPDDDGDTSDHADVGSMSLGGFGHPDDSKCIAVDNAMAAGVVMAVAAVNDGPNYETIGSPGCARDIISCGATSKTDLLASFSSTGPTAVYQIKPDLTGPGLSIYSTSRNNGYRYAGGTSMATPHVAGAAALLLQSHTGWTAQQVKQALMGTAKDIGYNEYRVGAGRIDVVDANDTLMLADPPSLSLGRLSAKTNTTTFDVTFENLASSWTNATLTWSIKYELTPLFTASGDATELKSMLTANTTAINMSGSSKFTVKFTLKYDSTSSVGHHLGNLFLTAGSDSIHVPIAFYIRAPVLLVDDDNTDHLYTKAPYNNHNPYERYTYPFYARLDSSKLIGDAMSSLGVSYDVVSVRTWYDGPDLANLSHYRVVIWNAAFDYSPYGNSLTSNDLKAIKDYADAGGNIWLLGSVTLFDLYGATNKTNLPMTDTLRAVFGMSGYARYAGTGNPLAGTAGTFLAGESYAVDTLSFGNVDYGNNLTPADGAFQVLSGSDTDYWGASWTNITSMIARAGTKNKTVFSAFEFGHLSSVNDRKDLVDEVLTWIDLSPHGAMSYSGALKEGETLTFSGSVLDPRAAESYIFEWDFDYTAPTFVKDDTGQQATHAYADDGTYTVAMRIFEERTSTYSQVVSMPLDVINQAPEAHINTSSPGDEGSPVGLWGNATDPGVSDTFTYEWDADYDGSTFNVDYTTQTVNHTYLDDGTYTVALRVTDDEGLTSPINTTDVVVRNLPPSGNVFTPGTSVEGDDVPFTAQVEDPSPLDTVSVFWDFEYNGQVFNEMANGTVVSHVYRDDGAYTVLMRMIDDDGGTNNVTLQVTVRNADPTASFVSTSPVQEGGVIDFNSTVEDPGVLDIHTFEWDFDYDGSTFDVEATRQNVSSQYAQDGNYTVALRVTDDDGGSVLVTDTVVITNAAPLPGIEAPRTADEGEVIYLNGSQNDPGILDTWTYLWDFGDGQTSTEKNPAHTYLDDGNFNITLNVTDDAGDWGVTTVRIFIVNVAPTATLEARPDQIDENGTIEFQADGEDPSPLDQEALTFTWNFGDGESSNLKLVRHRYVDDGCFTVTLTVQDDDGGFAVYKIDVLVNNVAPSVMAAADREYINEGEVVNFTAVIDDPGPLDTHTALWDFDDGSTSTDLEVTHRFADDGNYIVVLTVTDNSGGTNTTTFRVAVSNVRPTLTAEANTTMIKEGGSVSFTADWTDPGTEDTHTLVWDFGDGTNTTDQNPTHEFPQDGTYTVLVTVTDDDGGHASMPFIIDVENVAPVPTINVAVRTIDENNTVLFRASAVDPGPLDVVSFHWDFGDDSNPDYADDQEVVHLYADNGIFRVTLRAMDEDGGISPPTSVTITVNNVPPKNLKATADLQETTVGKGVTFSAYAEDDSPNDQVFYAWNFGDGLTSTDRTVTHVYSLTGDYKVVLIVSDDDGGQTPWETTIVVKPDMDGDGIPDEDDDDLDGDGYKNSEDDYPEDPDRYRNWTSIYLLLLVIVVVVIAVVAYMMTKR
ncbi:MAG: PKD domain-containing protein [Thermoplasmata archaeon]|nr:MAG: PKD domain-containing protein [Thermoplasmata archaeon]